MSVVTFEQIAERVADHARAEAVRNAPVAAARRAVFTLTSALADLSAADRQAVLDLLKDELYGVAVTA